VAVTAVSKTLEPITTPFLAKALFSRNMAVRQSAAIGLGQVANQGDEEIVKKLYRCFRHTNDLALKGFSLLSIGLIGGPVAVKSLDQVIRKGGTTDCPWACLAMGFALRKTGDARAQDHLLDLLATHANRSTRGAAAIGLGLMRCKEAVNPLIRSLQKADDPYLRGYCAMALGMIKDAAAIPYLKLALAKDDLPPVRTRAVMALALLDDRSAVPELTRMLIESKNETTKIFVALSLVFMGDVRIVEGIHEAIDKQELDDLTLSHCILLTSKLVMGQTMPYLNRLAVGSNFAYEYPFFGYLLDTGI
jgi:HEAT repeat protein